MGHVLVISRSKALQVLLDHLLREQGHSTALACDGDEGFSAIAFARPAVAIVDLRESEPDELLFNGLLRKRHPTLPVISLLAHDRFGFADGERSVVIEPSDADQHTLSPLLSVIRRVVDEVVLRASLKTWKPSPGLA